MHTVFWVHGITCTVLQMVCSLCVLHLMPEMFVLLVVCALCVVQMVCLLCLLQLVLEMFVLGVICELLVLQVVHGLFVLKVEYAIFVLNVVDALCNTEDACTVLYYRLEKVRRWCEHYLQWREYISQLWCS